MQDSQDERGESGPQGAEGDSGIQPDGSLPVMRLIVQKKEDAPGYLMIEIRDGFAPEVKFYTSLNALDSDTPDTVLFVGTAKGLQYTEWVDDDYSFICIGEGQSRIC